MKISLQDEMYEVAKGENLITIYTKYQKSKRLKYFLLSVYFLSFVSLIY